MLEQYKLIMPKTIYGGLNAISNVREIVKDVKKVAIFPYGQPKYNRKDSC